MARRKKKVEEEPAAENIIESIPEEPKEEPKETEPKVQRKPMKQRLHAVKEEMMQEYGDAIEWMTALHEGDVDKNGAPYWTHPLIVSIRAKKLAEKFGLPVKTVVISALLHDAVEDGHTSLSQVEARFGKDVAKIVGILTRNPNLTYMEYVKDIIASASKVAVLVKWSDLIHNTNPARMSKLNPKDKARLSKKYGNARKLIESVYPALKEEGRKIDSERILKRKEGGNA